MGLSLASWQALDLDCGLTASDSVMESSGKHCNTWIMGAYFGAIHRAHRGEIAKAFEMMDESELVARRLDDSLQRSAPSFTRATCACGRGSRARRCGVGSKAPTNFA